MSYEDSTIKLLLFGMDFEPLRENDWFICIEYRSYHLLYGRFAYESFLFIEMEQVHFLESPQELPHFRRTLSTLRKRLGKVDPTSGEPKHHGQRMLIWAFLQVFPLKMEQLNFAKFEANFSRWILLCTGVRCTTIEYALKTDKCFTQLLY